MCACVCVYYSSAMGMRSILLAALEWGCRHAGEMNDIRSMRSARRTFFPLVRQRRDTSLKRLWSLRAPNRQLAPWSPSQSAQCAFGRRRPRAVVVVVVIVTATSSALSSIRRCVFDSSRSRAHKYALTSLRTHRRIEPSERAREYPRIFAFIETAFRRSNV